MSAHRERDDESLVNQILSEQRERVMIRNDFAAQIAHNAASLRNGQSTRRAGFPLALIVVASLVTASTAVAGIAHFIRLERTRAVQHQPATCVDCEPNSVLDDITGAQLDTAENPLKPGTVGYSAETTVPDAANDLMQRGDTTVRLAAAPRYPGGGALVQDVSIGSEVRGPNYQFDRIMSAIVLRDGSIWVLDGPLSGAGAYQIRRFDAGGEFVASVSRMGQGPGELGRPQAPLLELRDGRVAVRDVARNKVDVFSSSGVWSEAWMFGATRLSGPSGGGNTLSSDTSGTVYLPSVVQRTSPPGPRTTPLSEDEERPTPIVVRVRKDGSILDTLFQPDLPKVSIPSARVDYRTPGGGNRGGGSGAAGAATAAANPGYYSIMNPVPFSPQSEWSASPLGYVVTTIGNRYAIDLRIPRAAASGGSSQVPTWRAGDPVVSIRRNVAPVVVSAAERRDLRAAIELRMSKGPPDLAPGAVVRPLAEIPTVKPLIRRVQFGLDGRIWVQISAPSERYDPAKHGERLRRVAESAAGWIEATMFDVFEPSGQYLGQIKLPYDINPVSMRGDIVLGVHTDVDGVQSVKKYRINWSASRATTTRE